MNREKLVCSVISVICALFIGQFAVQAWPEEPTYYGQILRLMQNKCIHCHHEGGIGGTDWSDYGQVWSSRAQISNYVGNRIMPPWNAAPEGQQGFPPGQGFAPNNELTQEQIDLIVGWVAAGAPAGDPGDAPPPLVFDDTWFQGEPDVVVSMAVEWTHPPGPDRYRCLPMQTWPADALDNDEIIIGFEVKPSNLEIAHHAVIYLVDEAAALAAQAADTLTPDIDNDGWDCFGGSGVGGTVLQGWAPGANAVPLLNEELGIALPADKIIVCQMHYHNDGAETQSDLTQIGLRLSSDPNILLLRNRLPTQLPGWTTPAISGPASTRNGGFGPQFPGETNTYQMTVSVNSDSHLVSVFPHMHLIGSRFWVTANLPDAPVLPIIYIDDWDFDWQLSYNFKQPIAMPAGTTLTVTGEYYNHTAANVEGGLFSNEEMLTLGTSLTLDADGIPAGKDTDPPRIIDSSIDTEGSSLAISITFSEAIVEPHFPSALDIRGPNGRVIPPDYLYVAGDTLFIRYDGAGTGGLEDEAGHELLLRGFFGVQDLNGNFLDGNANGIGGELADTVSISFQWTGVILPLPWASPSALLAASILLLAIGCLHRAKRPSSAPPAGRR